MTLISPDLSGISDGQTIDATDVSNPFNTIINDYNGNITNDNISSSAGLDPLKMPSTVKLVNRQDNNSSNGTVSTQRICMGWGWKLGDGTTAMTKAVTFPITYDSDPLVFISYAGQEVGSDPTAIGDLSSQSGWVIADTSAITTTGFTAGLSRTPKGDGTTQSFGNTVRFGFTWLAIGTKAS